MLPKPLGLPKYNEEEVVTDLLLFFKHLKDSKERLFIMTKTQSATFWGYPLSLCVIQ